MNRITPEINDRPFRYGYYKHLWYWLLVPAYLLLFYFAEQTVIDQYWVSYLPMDDAIPFVPWFVIPYVLWYPFMGTLGVYLSLRDVTGFKKYAVCLVGGMVSAVVFCMIFPNGQDLRPASFATQNFFTDLIGSIYRADTNTNVLPSMHVLGSMAVLFGVFHCPSLNRWWIRSATVLLGVLICAATVLIKQHSILDMFVAIPWGLGLYFLVYHLPNLIMKSRRKKSSASF